MPEKLQFESRPGLFSVYSFNPLIKVLQVWEIYQDNTVGEVSLGGECQSVPNIQTRLIQVSLILIFVKEQYTVLLSRKILFQFLVKHLKCHSQNIEHNFL